MTFVTASIVLYNTPESQLSRLLSCVQLSGRIDKVYIVDNSPVVLDYGVFRLPFIEYIKSHKNLGYGAAHNIALRRIEDASEYHFILNPDIYFDPEEIGIMVDRMIAEANIGTLMPRVVYPDGRLQFLCKLMPTPFDLFIRRFLRGYARGFVEKRMYYFEMRFTGYRDEMDVPFLSGCFILLRTEALKVVGLFDERFFMYAEDIDIARRMHSKFRTVYYPHATIVHDHARQSYKSAKMLWIHIVNIVKYFNKWGWFFDSERRRINAGIVKSFGTDR